MFFILVYDDVAISWRVGGRRNTYEDAKKWAEKYEGSIWKIVMEVGNSRNAPPDTND